MSIHDGYHFYKVDLIKKYNLVNMCYQEWTRDSALWLHSNLFKLGAKTDKVYSTLTDNDERSL